MNLSGKVLAITGSDGALGQAAAATLSGYGATLALIEHASTPSTALPAGALRYGGIDLTQENAARAGVERVVKGAGGFHSLGGSGRSGRSHRVSGLGCGARSHRRLDSGSGARMTAVPKSSPGARLRAAVSAERPLQVVGAINAYAARMAAACGFKALYLSGGGVAANSLGVPDLGISTMDDVLIDVRRITDACGLPLLVDADTGWGGAVNIARTVKSVIKFGAAGLHIEDQGQAKRFGHRPGKEVACREGVAACGK